MASHTLKVLEKRRLTADTFVLRFERQDFTFKTGQYLSLGLAGSIEQREYSVYSGEQEPWLEIIVREIPQGRVSPLLARVKPKDRLEVQGPFGFFLLDETLLNKPHLLLATGTGISPFHSFVATHPGANFQIVHGIRNPEECYEMHHYSKDTYLPCFSKPPQEPYSDRHYKGRLTKWLEAQELDKEMRVYLCGNCEMIYQAFDLLKARGIPGDQIFTEVYF